MLRSSVAPAMLLTATLLSGGCAGIPPDRGFSAVDSELAARGLAHAPSVAAPASVAPPAEWLSTPLTLDMAQRIALSHNPALLAQFAALGIAQADAFDAARLSNPRFSLAWLDGSGGSQITLGLAQNVAELLTLSPRKRLAAGEIARVQLEAGAALVGLAADTEAAYYRHVAALAGRALKRAIAEAGEVSADFAAALYAAGNINQLALDRERAAAASLGLEAVQADVEVAATRAALARLMGIGPDLDWQIVSALPLPASGEDATDELQRVAGAGRLDLLAAQRAVALLEDALGLTRSVRWLGDLELGVEHERDGTRLLGPTLAFQIPLFNQGQGRVTRAAARLDAARAAAQTSAIDVGHDVAQAQAAVVAAREIVARYRRTLLPLRERIVAGSRQLQNYMLTGQFDVLQDKLALYAAYDAYLRALGDYWVARANLSRAIGAPLPSAALAGAGVDPAALLATPAAPATPTPAHHAH